MRGTHPGNSLIEEGRGCLEGKGEKRALGIDEIRSLRQAGDLFFSMTCELARGEKGSHMPRERGPRRS